MSEKRFVVAGRKVYLATLADLGVAFGKSTRTMDRWLADGAPPRERHGYSLPDWFAWRMERAEQQAEAMEDAQRATQTEALERLRIASARLKELELSRLSKELVPIGPLVCLLRAAVGRFREAGDPLRDRFGVDAQRILDEACDAASESIDRMAAGPGVNSLAVKQES